MRAPSLMQGWRFRIRIQGMTIQQWACLDGLSKSFKEDNTWVEALWGIPWKVKPCKTLQLQIYAFRYNDDVEENKSERSSTLKIEKDLRIENGWERCREREMAPGEDKMRRSLVFQEFPTRNRGKRSPGPSRTIRDRKPKKFKIQNSTWQSWESGAFPRLPSRSSRILSALRKKTDLKNIISSA